MFRVACPVVCAATFILIPTPGPESTTLGCAAVPPRGGRVDISEESAIIVWDKLTKTEHFIRRASFKTDVKDFGFLVPTPSKPTLAEASDEAFVELARITAPPVRTQAAPQPGCALGCNSEKFAYVGQSVDVLETKRISGYDAAVLAATDAAALAKWLTDNGYESSDAIKRWLEPYIAKKWIITAFKIAQPSNQKGDPKNGPVLAAGQAPGASNARPGQDAVATSAVRMTFTTEQPFYPYREPDEQRTAEAGKLPRLLRIYYIGSDRVEGSVGDTGNFPGTIRWSKSLTEPTKQELASQMRLTDEKSPAAWWLTEFEDRSAPRPGTDDVYFRSSMNQDHVERTAMTFPGYPRAPGWPLLLASALVVSLLGVARLRQHDRGRIG